MGVNSLHETVSRQRRDCDLNPGPSAPESSTLTTRLPSHPGYASMSDRITLQTVTLWELSLVRVTRCAPMHRVKRRHRVYGHDTIAILWV